jgi:hypothetical protein
MRWSADTTDGHSSNDPVALGSPEYSGRVRGIQLASGASKLPGDVCRKCKVIASEPVEWDMGPQLTSQEIVRVFLSRG